MPRYDLADARYVLWINGVYVGPRTVTTCSTARTRREYHFAELQNSQNAALLVSATFRRER